jgi:hypothetical protein
MGILQIVSGTGAIALVGLGLALARFDELRSAYWLFWASGVVATLGAFWYGLTTLDPWPLRIGSEAVAGLYIGIALPMLFRWLRIQKVKAGIVSPTTS